MKTEEVLNLCLVFLAALGATGCTSFHDIRRVDSVHAVDEQRVYYALPRTAVVTTFPLTRVDFEAGRCITAGRSYTDPVDCGRMGSSVPLNQCLRLAPAFLPATAVKLGELAVTTAAEPDPDQVFQIRVTGTALRRAKVTAELAESGFLIAATSEFENKAAGLGVKVFQTVASLAGSLITAPGGIPLHFQEPTPLHPLVPLPPPPPCERELQEILAARSLARDMIENIATAATVVVPAETVQLVLDKLAAREKALVANFVKRTEKKGAIICSSVPTFRSLPPAGPFTRTLFELVADAGLRNIHQDCQVAVSFLDTRPGPIASQSVVLDVMGLDAPLLRSLRAAGVDALTARLERQEPAQGFYYRVPGFGRVVVKVGGAARPQTDVLIAQLGLVAALPRMRGRQSTQTVSLYESSGALKKVTSTATASTTESVAGVIDGIQTLVDAEIEAEDELARLERTRKILEERQKIEDLLEELAEEASDQ